MVSILRTSSATALCLLVLFQIINQLTPARISSLPFFNFDCGTEDSPLIAPHNRELAALMSEKKIPHEYRELPGDHSWAYWDRQIQEVLMLASQKLRNAWSQSKTKI
jgi:putative tributyrin esterase